MRFSTATLLTVLSSLISVEATCSYTGGNYYCSETSKVVYKGIGFSGSYQDVISMDESSGSCSQQEYTFSGNLSPLDEELSVHFRGPLKLLQFGVYYPSSNSSSSSNAKRDDTAEVEAEVEAEGCTTVKHHKHKRATAIVEVTQTVYVDGQGNLVTSQSTTTNTQLETDSAQTDLQAAIATQIGEGKAYRSISTKSAPTTTTASTASTSSSSSSSGSTESSEPSSDVSGAWTRDSYYTPGSTDNCVFLNYYGGSGSGVWSSAFGNSLSYANSDASGGSSSAVALEEVTIGSNTEYVIMSGNECSGSSCGFYRSGSVAYHGFGGAQKIFAFEFEMPLDSSASGYNADMPAIWLLNAKIPRTLQYGDESCSCWKTGCGELDLFEILSSGSDKLISHLHDGQGASSEQVNTGGGGSQDYFARPTSGSMKAVVIFTSDDIHIVQVDDSIDFDTSLTEDQVNAWIEQLGSVATIGY